MMRSDAVVIGGGIIGSTIALELARGGAFNRITVVDANRGPGEGSTSFSSSILRSFYSVRSSCEIGYESYLWWYDWRNYLKLSERTTTPTLRECGGLIMRSEVSAAYLDAVQGHFDVLGIPYETLDLTETAKWANKLAWDITKSYTPKPIDDDTFDQPEAGQSIKGSTWFPKTTIVSDPRLATQNVWEAAVATGKVHGAWKSVVKEVNSANGATTGVTLQDGQFLEAPVVVNAAGPHSFEITNMALGDRGSALNDMTVTTHPLRTEVGVVDAPPGCDYDRDGVVTFDFDCGTYMRPESQNRMIFGGIEPSCDPLAIQSPFSIRDALPSSDSMIDLTLGEQWQVHAYRTALRVPTMTIPGARHAKGIVSFYDVTEDWTAVLDKSLLRGYFMAIGTSGSAFKTAPVIGHAMARMIEEGNDTSIPTNRTDGGRSITLPRTGWQHCMEGYARNRTLGKCRNVTG